MPPRDLAARVRAAFAYKGLSKTERAQALGVSVRQATRIESGQAGIPDGRLEQIAQVTGVPLSFLVDGFVNDAPSAGERIEALEHQYAALRAEIAEARTAAVEALAAQASTIARHSREIAALRADRRRREQAAGNDQ